MAVPELSDIENATIRAEIEEWLDRPEEIERNVELFAGASSAMQAIAAPQLSKATMRRSIGSLPRFSNPAWRPWR